MATYCMQTLHASTTKCIITHCDRS
uniref:Uncharacterized protein n=1 Tax=Amphimedon queenslandica TaxID=400682 RepID=A0A1X7UFI9_AMPQE